MKPTKIDISNLCLQSNHADLELRREDSAAFELYWMLDKGVVLIAVYGENNFPYFTAHTMPHARAVWEARRLVREGMRVTRASEDWMNIETDGGIIPLRAGMAEEYDSTGRCIHCGYEEGGHIRQCPFGFNPLDKENE